MLQKLISNENVLTRKYKKSIMIVFDLGLIYTSIVLSIFIRIGYFHESMFKTVNQLWMIPFLGVATFALFGLYSIVVRFVDSGYTLRIFKATLAVAVLLQSAVFFIKPDFFPRSSVVIFFLVCTALLMSSRAVVRWLFRQILDRRSKKKKVLIYGSGSAGIQTAQGLKNSPEYQVVAFIDDDKSLHGQFISEIKVYSNQYIDRLISEKNIDEIIIAIPSASRKRKKDIIDSLKSSGVVLKMLPGLADIIGGKVQLSDIREVSVIDLLGRDEVPPNQDLLDRSIRGQVVLITGAGGSIGSELCRQIANIGPTKMILLDHSEYNLYSINQELESKNYNFPIISVLADIKNSNIVEKTIKAHGVDTIYHAAAYKHVPLVEENYIEGLNNNVFGTESVAKAAIKAKVKRFILISTDKAVRPTNIMGASKRIAELILQSLSLEKTDTIFSMVRFGNVLGSSGSVVPLFQNQIKIGGPVTVTHPDVTRYFMTIPEAAQLVIQAGSMAKGGEVFVLDMGAPIKIVDLAKRMIELSGFTLKNDENINGDIEISFVGLRPGEKLYEELLIGDNVESTEHTRIMKANEICLSKEQMIQMLNELKSKMALCSSSEIKDFLRSQKLNYMG